MKELELKLEKTKVTTEVSMEKRLQIEKELTDAITPKNGHKIFEINTKTLEIKEAIFDAELTFVLGEKNNKSITTKEGCVYIPALNKKNALEKYKKGKFRYENSNFKPIKIGL